MLFSKCKTGESQSDQTHCTIRKALHAGLNIRMEHYKFPSVYRPSPSVAVRSSWLDRTADWSAAALWFPCLSASCRDAGTSAPSVEVWPGRCSAACGCRPAAPDRASSPAGASPVPGPLSEADPRGRPVPGSATRCSAEPDLLCSVAAVPGIKRCPLISLFIFLFFYQLNAVSCYMNECSLSCIKLTDAAEKYQ